VNLAPALEALIAARVLPMFPELLDEPAPIPLSVLKLAATLLVAHPPWVADIERCAGSAACQSACHSQIRRCADVATAPARKFCVARASQGSASPH